MKQYTKASVPNQARIELHDILNLTGAEISVNQLAAGQEIPFVHAHKENEEIYAVLSGSGAVVIDDEKIALKAGDWIRIAPQAKRQFSAAADEGISYICIQVKENSLGNYTAEDAVIG